MGEGGGGEGEGGVGDLVIECLPAVELILARGFLCSKNKRLILRLPNGMAVNI